MRIKISLLFVICFSKAIAQQQEDSIKASAPFTVVVQAYEQNRRLLDVAGSVAVVGQGDLNRYNSTSLVPALNALPGIKMEERSPGSYRINIRGSSLRAPFGVRNVKVYYNDFPLTDPGGNTYLNQLGFYNIANLEIVKGPGSSLYGAGTGGVMLIESMPASRNSGVRLDQSFGSYGLSNTHVQLDAGNSEHFNSLGYQRISSDGYRDQSAMKRQVLNWDASTRVGNNMLTAHLLYSSLNYQTPGALTLAEFIKDPSASRPRAGTAPGAVEARAAIYLKTFVAGAGYKQIISNKWQNSTSVYGAFAELKNPAIRNYGRNVEPHVGGRTVFKYTSKEEGNGQLIWHTGAEFQQAFNTVQVFNNKAGVPDSLLTNDEIRNYQYFIFTQLSYQLNQWTFTAGISANKSKVNLNRTSSVPAKMFERKFDNQLAPRLAALYKLSADASLYASFSKGFSPPTIGELSPSGSAINSTLNAETGYNTEMGSRGAALQNRLSWDVAAFYYKLTNSIVQRRDAFGGDYFINAGSTAQKGIETYLSYRLFNAVPQLFNTSSKVWITHAWNHFRYKQFKQVDTDFSGNEMPGVAPHFVTAGVDLYTNHGLYANLTYQHSSKAALNDANSQFADAFNLFSIRAGYKKQAGKLLIELFAGVDNLFNETYSLGNDINAFGGRYYNAAAKRNYVAGISLQQAFKKKAAN